MRLLIILAIASAASAAYYSLNCPGLSRSRYGCQYACAIARPTSYSPYCGYRAPVVSCANSNSNVCEYIPGKYRCINVRRPCVRAPCTPQRHSYRTGGSRCTRAALCNYNRHSFSTRC